MRGKIAATLIALLLTGAALCACSGKELNIGGVKSAEARWLDYGNAGNQRGLTQSEQETLVERLNSCRLEEPKGDLVSPFGCIRIETDSGQNDSKSPAIYTLYVFEGYESWILEVEKDGQEKNWVLRNTEDLGEIVKGILEGGDWDGHAVSD